MSAPEPPMGTAAESPTGTEPVKILCITGWCRNGSTILGNVLNEVPGFFHVGELHFLWKNSAGRGVNNLCGCGATLTECPIWSQILPVGRPAGSSPEQHAAEVIRRQQAAVRTRHTWRVLRRGSYSADLREHGDLMRQVYSAVAERTGARVIVDTTKIPGESALLPLLPGIEPYFVHLVRDPRAVAYSWRRPKQYVYTMSASRSTGYWTGFNIAAHALTRAYPQRSMLLRYEDFIADPAAGVATLLAFCGEAGAPNPVAGRTVTLHPNHTVTGNPDRFHSGETVIRPSDSSWRDGLGKRAQLASTLLSWPLCWRYRYLRRGYPGGYPRGSGPDNRLPASADSQQAGGTVGSGA